MPQVPIPAQQVTIPGQTINVPDTDLSALNARLAAVEAKNTAQDSTIAALDARVRVLEGVPANGIVIAPGDSWQAKIDAAPAAAVFTVKGLHSKVPLFTPKTGQVFVGDGTAILDGGTTLTKVLDSRNDNVTLRKIEFRYYKSPLQHGAIDGDWGGGKNWLLDTLDVHHMFSAGVGIGSGWQMIGGKVHDCGQIGLKASAAVGAIYDGVEVFKHHYDPGVPAWGWNGATQGGNLAETGGSKFSQTKNLIVRNMNVHDNDGPGLWTDIDNFGTLYETNEVWSNAGAGIFHEISYDAIIRNNHVHGNGSPYAWLWNAAIQIAASGGVGAGIIDIYGNLIEDCINNICLIQQDRQENSGATTLQPHVVRNVKVHENTTRRGGTTGIAQDTKNVVDIMLPAQANSFDRNAYEGAFKFPGPFSKTGQDGLSWASWQGLGYDKNGSYR